MIKKTAFAKLDLAIHINPNKLSDGYHPVDYIVSQINLSDELLIEQKENNIEIICDQPNVPKNKENFIYLAAQLLKEMAQNRDLGAKIILNKNIPIKAGFGGGSSDAAAVTSGLSKLWNINLDEKQLADLATVLGKDFYYSLHGGLSEVQGRGKDYKVIPLSSKLPNFWLLVIVPFEEKPSTGWVYEHLYKKKLGKNSSKFEKLKLAIQQKNKEAFLDNLFNDFEDSVILHFPIVKKIKHDLKEAGALQTLMAGAGLSVVGFFSTQKEAESTKQKLKNKYKQVIITKPIN